MKQKSKLAIRKEDWEPVDQSQRVPFEIKRSISPTRHQYHPQQKLQNLQISAMSARKTFIDSLTKSYQLAPGPASYRTSSSVAKTCKSSDMSFEPRARELRISDQLSCNDYLERASIDRAYDSVLPTVSRFSFSRLERFYTQHAASSPEVDIPSWLYRSTSIGTRMNGSERFSTKRAELPRVSKGKRWYDY